MGGQGRGATGPAPPAAVGAEAGAGVESYVDDHDQAHTPVVAGAVTSPFPASADASAEVPLRVRSGGGGSGGGWRPPRLDDFDPDHAPDLYGGGEESALAKALRAEAAEIEVEVEVEVEKEVEAKALRAEAAVESVRAWAPGGTIAAGGTGSTGSSDTEDDVVVQVGDA